MSKNKSLGQLILELAIIIFGCADKKTISMSGNWYFFNSDSIYSEAYFKEGKLVFYDEDLGGGPMYRYSKKRDSIYIYYRDSLEYVYRVKFIDDRCILLGNNQDYTLYSLKAQSDYFSLPNTMEAVDEFDYEFTQRMFRNKP